ncbi:hypothetical protein PLEOSDRAFT_159778 [Pleurotus ostreatus PC15]|uniref:Protein-S-isoprenylcysteine O-methyltransferase n=1 Tax=Pleurotus ostreatus (strain PC15) TaxID=1137138 RepID=A0A067NE57_PLEO1|nr:hypothetical protein PLEOSDRAFT_159778 [Pleurotus ostreatus PC15]
MGTFLNASNWVVLATGLSYYVTATPPNRRVNRSELLINTWVERFLLTRLMFLKIFVGSACLMHILSTVFSMGICTTRTSSSSSESPTSLSTTMILGGGLALLSASIRLWCYAEMRDLYDFEVDIKKAHRLVTSGPYAFVRHPGYIASCGARIGVTMVMFSKDHWLYQCGLRSAVGVVLSCIWCAEVVVINGVLIPARMKVEDDRLRRHFGGEWDDYASRVAYRLVPGIY